MMRLTLILLCLLLAAAAAGRYQAEAAVREQRGELQRLDKAKRQELAAIQLLRAEVAYLESPERLAEIAGKLTDLEPLSGAQLMTAEDFAVAFSVVKEATDAPAVAPSRLEVAGLETVRVR